MIRRPKARDDGFACIDPTLGEQLPLGLAGLLDEGARERIDAHVAACHACSNDARIMRHLLRAVGSISVEDSVRAGLATTGTGTRSMGASGRLLSWSSMLATAALLVGLTAVAVQQRAPDRAVASEVRALGRRVASLEEQSRQAAFAATGALANDRPSLPIGVQIAAPVSY